MGIWAVGVELTTVTGQKAIYGGICFGNFLSLWSYGITRKDIVSTKVYVYCPRAYAKRYSTLWPKIMRSWMPDRMQENVEFGTFTVKEYNETNAKYFRRGDNVANPHMFAEHNYDPCFTVTVKNLNSVNFTDWLTLHTLAMYPQRRVELLNKAYRWWLGSKKKRSLDWAWWINHGSMGDQGHMFWGSYPKSGWVVNAEFYKREATFNFKEMWTNAPWVDDGDMIAVADRRPMNTYFGGFHQSLTKKMTESPAIRKLRNKMFDLEDYGKYEDYLVAKDTYHKALEDLYVSDDDVWKNGAEKCAI